MKLPLFLAALSFTFSLFFILIPHPFSLLLYSSVSSFSSHSPAASHFLPLNAIHNVTQ